MKPLLKLSDFWAIYDEKEEDGLLIVNGRLSADTEIITAKFHISQGGPKGGWSTTDY